MSTELLEPVVEDGVRITNFFNGRILTAEDLRREQDAARDRHRGLAGAVGEGVVQGLEVTAVKRDLPAPTVRVSAGLGFNRDGDPVALPRDVELRLIPAQAETDEEAGLFAVCDRPSLVAEISNPGFYILAARPASALSREQVPTVDLGSEGVGTKCGSRYAELGASFSLVPLPLPAGSASAPLAQKLTQLSGDVTSLVDKVRGGDSSAATALQLAKAVSKLRNGVAYWCAGRDAAGPRVAGLAAPPPVPPAQAQPPLEALRAAGALASCDLPIALLFVTRLRLEWVDLWSVRRQPVPRLGPDPLTLAGDLPPAEAVASFMQFRDHASWFLGGEAPVPAGQVQASDWFLFLPPAGVLPLGSGGFAATTFFQGAQASSAASLDAPRIPALLRASLEHPPVELAASDRIWLYDVSGAQAPQPQCLLFAGYPLEPDLFISPVSITKITPGGEVTPKDPHEVHVGEPLDLQGENFEPAEKESQVLIDGVPVPKPYLIATDTQLRFNLPAVPNVPEAGRAALLIVSNRSTSAFRPIRVLQQAGPPSGFVDVEFVQMLPDTLLPGSPALFRFTVRNRTDRQGAVQLSAAVSVTAWQSLLQVLPAATATSTVTSVVLEAGQERSVFVRITQIPTSSAGTNFTIALTAVLQTLTGSSGAQAFTVGDPSVHPDPHVTSLNLVSTIPSSSLQGGKVFVSPYYPVQALVNLTVDLAATYVISAHFVNSSGDPITLNGWSISQNNQDQQGEVSTTVTQQQLTQSNGLVTISTQILLTNNWYGADQTGSVLVRVKRTGQEQVREIRFDVERSDYWWGYYGWL